MPVQKKKNKARMVRFTIEEMLAKLKLLPLQKKKKAKMVRFTIEEVLEKSKLLQPGEKSLAKLKAMKDEDIDYSDIPPITAEFWKNAVLVRPRKKKLVTLRIDEEILEFFKKTGKGYQSFMNDVLRTYAEAHKKFPHNT